MRRTGLRLCVLLAGAGLASSLAAAAPAAAGVPGPGDITTVAGGPGRAALTVAQDAGSVAAGPAGDVYVGDSRGVVRGLTSGTSWETVTAGNATQNLLSGPRDRVAATVAPLDSVDGLAVDTAGNVAISDGLDFLVWVVAARAGTFYGQAMKAGDIYSIAGTGNFGYSGDGGPATSAELGRPGRAGLRPLRQPADRGFPGRRRAGGRGPDGHVLRPGHEGRRHLHHRRDGHVRLLRRRQTGGLGRAFRSRRGDHRPGRERGHRGHR